MVCAIHKTLSNEKYIAQEWDLITNDLYVSDSHEDLLYLQGL